MSWQAAGTRFKASAYDSGDSSYKDEVVLPIVTMEVMPLSYRPEGSTQQELYDGRAVFLEPDYGYQMSFQINFERTKYVPSIYGLQDTNNYRITVDPGGAFADVLALHHYYDFVDYFVRYENGSYKNFNDNPGSFSDYKCPKMIPDISEDVGSVSFDNQVRTKERSLELRSTYNDKTYSDIRWILD